MNRDPFGALGTNNPSSNQIRGSEKKALTGFLIGGVLLTVVPLLFIWRVHMPIFIRPGIPNPFVGIISLIGGILFCRAIWEILRLKRFGDPALDLAQVPVPLGGKIKGRLDLGPRYATAPEFTLKLQCIRCITQNTGKSSSTREKILWSGESKTSLLPGGAVPVSLAVPGDQIETSNEDPWNRILWRLTVTAPFRGIGFLEKYEIPVQGRTSTAQSEPNIDAGTPPVTGRKLFLATLPFLIVGLAVLTGGFYLLTLGLADIAKANASTRWPTVAGRIVNSIPPLGGAIFANPQITYKYEVYGVVHTSDTIYPHLFWKRSAGLRMAQNFPPSAPVTVHYAPDHPDNACLVPGLRAGAFQRLVVAMIAMLGGFLFASSAILAPKYGMMTGNTITYRKGSPGSRIFGYTFLAIFVLVIVLWIVS